VYDKIRNQFRDKVRAHDYIVPTHARREMVDDGLDINDIEHIILTGEIVERQRDRKSGEWKYIIRGHTEAYYEPAYAVAKFDLNGEMVIITVYLE
jgi:hypothetical protein